MNTPTKPVEQKARELLAAEYDSDVRKHEGWGHKNAAENQRLKAQAIRDGKAEFYAVRAIIAAFNTDEERIRREAFEEAAKVALSFGNKDWESYDPRTIASAIRALSTPSKGVG